MNKVFLENHNKHPRDDGLTFIESIHKYTLVSFPDVRLISVTSFLHDCFEDFDADKVIEKLVTNPRCKYFNRSVEEIKNEWKSANLLGTEIHAKIEDFMNEESLSYPYSHEDLLQRKSFQDDEMDNNKDWLLFLQFAKTFNDKIPYRTEWRVYCEELRLAGSIDMVYLNADGTISIFDWKRTTDLDKRCGFKNKMSLKFPETIPDTKFHKYSLQLNLYKAIVEKNYGFKVKELVLVGLHPTQQTFELHHCVDFSKEVQQLFEEILLYKKE